MSQLLLIKNILQNKAPGAPSLAILNITTVCNLRCEFCWIHSPKQRNRPRPTHVPTETLLRIIDELADMGTSMISISGDGEPTCHPGFVDIVNAIKRRRLKFRVTTNLSFTDPRIAAACARADTLHVNFSADNEAAYSAVHAPRGPNVFRQVVHNLRILSRAAQRNRLPAIEINFIVTKNNYRRMARAVVLAEKLSVPNIRFRILDTTPATRTLFLNQPERKRLMASARQVLKRHPVINSNLESLQHDIAADGAITFRLDRCFIGWLRLSIESNGDIGLCCQHGRLTIGNWRRHSVREAWRGRRASLWRKKLRDNFDLKDPFWQSCLFCCAMQENQNIERVLRKAGA